MKKQVSQNRDSHSPPQDSAQEVAQILSAHRGETHAIVMHDFPDPDAISSAYAHRLLSAGFNIETDILYAGRVSHTQNLAMVHLLEIDLLKYEGELPRHYDSAVFVDNQGTTCAQIVTALEESGIPALMVVDHHEKQDRLQPVYCDVRNVGATATIYAEYLREGRVELQHDNKQHVVVATALMHGLISDTDNFIRAHKADFEAAAFLSEFVDSDLLTQILSQGRSRQVMETIHKALNNRVLVENFSVVGIGYLRAEDRDAIPQAADFLLTEANVLTTIIYGIVVNADNTESLIGSMRTTDISINPDEFIKEVLGRDEDGDFYGGGKAMAGGFEIPVGFLSGGSSETQQDLKWQVYDRQVKHKIFTKIGVTIDEGAEDKQS